MNNEPLTLEAEAVRVERTKMPQALDITFSSSNEPKSIPVGGRAEAPHLELRKDDVSLRPVVKEFLKPTISNLALLGCLVGLFFLYCCSCLIHALSLATRKRVS